MTLITVKEQIGTVEPGDWTPDALRTEHAWAERRRIKLDADLKDAQERGARGEAEFIEDALVEANEIEDALWKYVVGVEIEGQEAIFGSTYAEDPPQPGIHCIVPGCPNMIRDAETAFKTVQRCEVHQQAFDSDLTVWWGGNDHEEETEAS